MMKYILDANNICRYGSTDGEVKVHISYLSSIIVSIEEKGLSWFCFTDANLKRLIAEYASDKDRELYDAMLRRYPDKIVSVSGGQQADSFILQKANEEDGHVISNDLYRQYVNIFPWLKIKDDDGVYLDNNRRRVHGFVVAERVIQIPDLGISRALDRYENTDRNWFFITPERAAEIELGEKQIRDEAKKFLENNTLADDELDEAIHSRLFKAMDRLNAVKPGDSEYKEAQHEFELSSEIMIMQSDRLAERSKEERKKGEKMDKEAEELLAFFETTEGRDVFRRAKFAKAIEERSARGEYDGFWGGIKGFFDSVVGGVWMATECEKDKKSKG